MSEDRIRVMHVVFSLETGGLENGVVNLCNRLNSSRFEPSICVFRGGGELEARVDTERVELLAIKRLRDNDPTLPFRLAVQLRRRRIDVLHTHSWGTLVEGVIAGKIARTPSIVHGEHGVLETRRHNILIQRWLWPGAHKITAVATPLADQMADLIGFPRNRIQVIPNGVDDERFRPRPDLRAEVRRQHGLSQSDLVVGMIARLVPIKNHEGVLRAIADLSQQGMRVTLALAGDGPLLGKLRSMATDLELEGQVYFLGDLDNVHQFLNAVDIFVLNSHSEGMSNTILEAMSCGLPVVATSVGANSELVIEGQTGLLVPPDDPPALANAIANLAENRLLRLRMGDAGRARIEKEFGIERMVQDYSQLYCELQNGCIPTVVTPHDYEQPEKSHELGARSTPYRSTR